MNRNFLNTANSNVIQSPITFEPTEKTLNRASSIIDSLPFLCLIKQRFLMTWIYLNNWLCSVLAINKVPQLTATIASVTNNIFRMELAIGESRLAENSNNAKSTTIYWNLFWVVYPREQGG